MTDVNSRQDFSGSNSHYDFLSSTCDFLGINRQLIPVSYEYRSVLQLLRSGEHFNGSTFCPTSYPGYFRYSREKTLMGAADDLLT